MWLNSIAVIGGLIVLLAAGESLVRGAVGLANRLNIPPLLIGLTIVAFGTSAPELVVSIQAVISGENGIAMGNIVGSNIANIFLVLGLPAIMASICTASEGLRRHAFVMLGATALFAYVVYGPGVLEPTMGLIMLLLIAVYVAYVGFSATRPGGTATAEMIEEVTGMHPDGGLGKSVVLLVVGLIGLPIGGWVLVTYGAELASMLGVRDEIIGLTVVAFGTSLPELATVWAAALKRHADVAVGNIVGSNIFNILFVGGAAGLAGTTQFNDLDGSGFSDLASSPDIPVMIGATIILAYFIFTKGRISRLIGALFLVAYIAYIAFISTAAVA